MRRQISALSIALLLCASACSGSAAEEVVAGGDAADPPVLAEDPVVLQEPDSSGVHDAAFFTDLLSDGCSDAAVGDEDGVFTEWEGIDYVTGSNLQWVALDGEGVPIDD